MSDVISRNFSTPTTIGRTFVSLVPAGYYLANDGKIYEWPAHSGSASKPVNFVREASSTEFRNQDEPIAPLVEVGTTIVVTPPSNTADILPIVATVESKTTSNPYLSYTELQLQTEKAAIDAAIALRLSKGLSLDYPDMPLIELYTKKALVMAALTPLLIKKYGLYAAGGLTLFLVVKILFRRSNT